MTPPARPEAALALRWRLLRGVALAGAILAGGAGVWWIYFGRAPEGQWDRGDNGAWMRRHWIHGAGDPSDPGVDPGALAGELSALGIRRIYPFLGPMDPDGWPGWRDDGQIQRYDPERAGWFFAEMERLAPEVSVLPWSGGVLRRDVRLLDAAQRAAFAEHARAITALGADGIQLNVEPMPSWSPGYLELLEATKEAIGPDKILSVAAYPPETPLHPFPEVHWELDFLWEVCRVADDVAVMAYDTALAEPVVYETLVATWTRELAETMHPPSEGGCEWSMGVPAYEDDEPWHRPDVETMQTGLRGVVRGLAGLESAPSNFTGVAIYASWTTDAAEWAAYERMWRGLDPSGAVITEN